MHCESSDIEFEVGFDEPNIGYYWGSLDKHYQHFVNNIWYKGTLIAKSCYKLSASHFELHCDMSIKRYWEPCDIRH